jgi:hypothetical protein
MQSRRSAGARWFRTVTLLSRRAVELSSSDRFRTNLPPNFRERSLTHTLRINSIRTLLPLRTHQLRPQHLHHRRRRHRHRFGSLMVTCRRRSLLCLKSHPRSGRFKPMFLHLHLRNALQPRWSNRFRHVAIHPADRSAAHGAITRTRPLACARFIADRTITRRNPIRVLPTQVVGLYAQRTCRHASGVLPRNRKDSKAQAPPAVRDLRQEAELAPAETVLRLPAPASDTMIPRRGLLLHQWRNPLQRCGRQQDLRSVPLQASIWVS